MVQLGRHSANSSIFIPFSITPSLLSAEAHIDLALLRRIAHGDRDAFEQLFHLYKEKAYAVARQVLKEPYLAEELVQELFIAIWQKRNNLLEVSDPDAYLFRMVRNLSIDLLRKHSREQQHRNQLWERIKDQQVLEQQLQSKELSALIQQAIDALPEKRRELFLLSRHTDLTLEAIARQSGISKNTVKTHLLLAVKDIRTFLQKHRYLGWLLPLSAFL